MNHVLKTWPVPFQAMWDGTKTFEFRWNDRNFQEGDFVTLAEWNPETETYTGRTTDWTVGYLLTKGYGLPKGYCVFSLLDPHL